MLAPESEEETLAPMLVPHGDSQGPLCCPFNNDELIRVAKRLIENQKILYGTLLNLNQSQGFLPTSDESSFLLQLLLYNGRERHWSHPGSCAQ